MFGAPAAVSPIAESPEASEAGSRGSTPADPACRVPNPTPAHQLPEVAVKPAADGSGAARHRHNSPAVKPRDPDLGYLELAGERAGRLAAELGARLSLGPAATLLAAEENEDKEGRRASPTEEQGARPSLGAAEALLASEEDEEAEEEGGGGRANLAQQEGARRAREGAAAALLAREDGEEEGDQAEQAGQPLLDPGTALPAREEDEEGGGAAGLVVSAQQERARRSQGPAAALLAREEDEDEGEGGEGVRAGLAAVLGARLSLDPAAAPVARGEGEDGGEEEAELTPLQQLMRMCRQEVRAPRMPRVGY